MKPIIAITAGDVAGIGPEVIVRALMTAVQRGAGQCDFVPVLVGHPEVFQRAVALCGCDLTIEHLPVEALTTSLFRRALEAGLLHGRIACINPAGDDVLNAPDRSVNSAAGDAAFRYLDFAIQLALQKQIDAIATAPLNKEALHLAGHHYPGHTEILAERCGVDDFAMMLHLPESALSSWRQLVRPLNQKDESTSHATHGLSIAHVTLHTSVESVPRLLSVDNVCEKISLMSNFLRQIGCRRSSIAVCALNPHGGENGLFGNEEQTIIRPAVERSRATMENLHGPLPVDTLIRRAISGEFDGVVAMYHDQGHIPVKLIGFDAAINITLGLPIVRTSPTHGTAFDRAWNPETPADGNGMFEAIRMAAMLCQNVAASSGD